jgi:hypothetical protein
MARNNRRGALSSFTVDLSPQPISDNEATIRGLGDELEVDFDQDGDVHTAQLGEFGDNLVELIDPTELGRLSDDVIEWIDADARSREPWLRRFRNGLQTAGIIDRKEDADLEGGLRGVLKGVNEINHPMLLEACIQFQARAIAEIYPPTGPVKGRVLGHNTQELLDQAQRVAGFMNYQITELDKSYFWDTDQMLFLLPLVGSAFKKTYWDPLLGCVRSVLVHADDVLVPYTASSVHDTPRLTHRMPTSHNDLLRYQQIGFYADVDIPEAQDPYQEEQDLGDEIDNRQSSIAEGDAEHILYESHCLYRFNSLPEAEDSDEGIEFPYIVTIDKETRKVLGVRRHWKEADSNRRLKQRWTHYKYLPGLGFYGFGLIHAMGGLSEASTALVRAIIIGGAYASMPGGFKSKTNKMKGDLTIEPGLFKDCDMDYDELSKALWSPTFRDPSAALVGMLDHLTQAGQRLASTTEAMVGEANNQAPVGTTLALIEQGGKIYSAIHLRIHVAAGEEFRIRFDVNSEHLPEEYPYQVGEATRSIARADFSDRMDVVPVSDPKIFSSAQRLAIAQATLQLAESAPEMYDTYEAHRRMLESMSVPDIDKLLPNPNTVPHADPVSEGSYLLVGKPIRAHADEDHDAHMLVHQAQAQQFQAYPPQIANRIMPALMAHIAEHYALQYRIQVSLQIGVQLPPIDLASKQRDDQPTDLGNRIAVAAGMAIQMQRAQEQAAAQAQAEAAATGAGQPPEAPEQNPRFVEEQARKDAALQGDLQRDQLRNAARFLQDNSAQDIPPQALVETSQQLGRSFDEALRLIREAQAQGQGLGPFPETEKAING